MNKTLLQGARSLAMAAALLAPAAGCSLLGNGGAASGEGPASSSGGGDSARPGGAKPFKETLPPALPLGLTPDEARAQAMDSPAATFDVDGQAAVPVDLSKPPFGFVRLIAAIPKGANPPALRVAEEGAEPESYGPAVRLRGTAAGGKERWEYFLVNDPSKKAKAEFVPR
jgi:hypothetical protein